MIICLPGSVRFPVTITELAKKQGDKVNRLDTLLFYSYKAKVTTYPEFGVEKIEEKELNSKFDAPVDGELKSWLIKPGTVIHNSRYDGVQCGLLGNEAMLMGYITTTESEL